MNQTWKNDKKRNFGLDFRPFRPHLGYQIFFFAGFTSISS